MSRLPGRGPESLSGVAGLEQIPYSPWLLPVLVGFALVNLGSTWLRGRWTGRINGFYTVCAGMLAIFASKTWLSWEMSAFFSSGAHIRGLASFFQRDI